MSNIIKYETEGLNEFQVLVDEETVWLTQVQIAELFGTQRPAITKHLNNIYKSGELEESSTCSILERMGNAGQQRYHTKYYNLDVILSVGYRVNSKRATQFRIWANKVLKDYLLKGYAVRRPVDAVELNEVRERLKELELRLDSFEAVTDTQVGELYDALIELVSRRQVEDKQPRGRIGFQLPNSDEKQERVP